jgi:hypothetical protein
MKDGLFFFCVLDLRLVIFSEYLRDAVSPGRNGDREREKFRNILGK